MTGQSYTIRPMTRADLDIAADWAAAEGWNPGRHDAACYWKADPKGFFMGVLGNTPVASISLVTYGSSFAFLGFYIVVPEHRGKGYGLAIWRHAMATADSRNIGLDGVVDQQDNYKKSGFTLAFRNIRFRGIAGTPAEKTWATDEPPPGSALLPLDRIPVARILAYDRAFFPENRSGFLKTWISQPRARGLGLMKGDTLEGWGLIRECRRGYKIGPLFADTPAGARQIFTALFDGAPAGSEIFLDVPEPNGAALELARSRNMRPCFETARMYTGPFPRLPAERIYGITSFEVG